MKLHQPPEPGVSDESSQVASPSPLPGHTGTQGPKRASLGPRPATRSPEPDPGGPRGPQVTWDQPFLPRFPDLCTVGQDGRPGPMRPRVRHQACAHLLLGQAAFWSAHPWPSWHPDSISCPSTPQAGPHAALCPAPPAPGFGCWLRGCVSGPRSLGGALARSVALSLLGREEATSGREGAGGWGGPSILKAGILPLARAGAQ